VTAADPEEATLLVELAPGVEVKVARGAIGTVITPDDDNVADPEQPGVVEDPADHPVQGTVEGTAEKTNPTTDNEER
jgi:hypothetical protein